MLATRQPADFGMPDVARLIQYGASPRASLGIVRATRALALLRGRDYALPQDVLDIAPDILRHRLVLSYDALADDIPADRIVERVLATVPLPTVVRPPERRTAAAAERPQPGRGRSLAGPAVTARRRPAQSQPVSAVPGSQPLIAASRAEPALSKLQLMITRRLDGLLQGDYLGLLTGPGTEPGESREYRPGDDVRRMDWPVTARTTVPHVRQTVADRELETWLAVDLSASLDFGTARSTKRDLAIAASAAMAYLTTRGGNRIGAVVGTGDAGAPDAGPAGPEGDAGPAARDRRVRRRISGRSDLGALIDALNRPPRRRGMAVVISDFLVPPEQWAQPLRKLGVRHDLLAIEMLDPRELEMPDGGVMEFVDPETGAMHEVQTSDPKLRARYAGRGGRTAGCDSRGHPRRRRRSPAAAYRLGLAVRHRPIRRRPATRTYEGDHPMIRFLQPWWLLAVLPVLAIAGAYVWRTLHRRAYAVRFTNVDLLRTIAPKGLGYRRHLAAGGVPADAADARDRDGPAVGRTRSSRWSGRPIMIAIDVSLSMESTDVAPSRIQAAQAAAKEFVKTLPAVVQRGAGLVREDRERAGVADQGPRRGDRRRSTACNWPRRPRPARRSSPAWPRSSRCPPDGAAGPPPARIVLLSDGYRTAGRPIEEAAAAAQPR